ncbi:MAG: acyl--CoA ligase [Proteobacteria bacterium]|nr:acyl--CoA ligase [Pseudomonadota bacterium]
MNYSMLLDMAAEAHPGRIAVTCDGSNLSYASLRGAAGQAARRMSAAPAGQPPAAHAAWLDTNSLATPVALFAAAYAGIPYVPLNYRLTAAELQELLARIAPAWLAAGPAALDRMTLPAGIQVVPSAGLVAGSAAQPAAASPEAPQDPRAIAVQLFTSGTSGTPKAAVLRHENVLSYILGSVEFGSAGEEEAALVAVPPYHIAGISALLSSTYAGRRVVLMREFEPREWLHLLAAESITHAFVVPTMLVRILEALRGERRSFPALRALAYGGGRMPLAVIERALEVFPGVGFTNAYGLTETSSTICLLTPEDHRAAAGAADALARQRLGSVGRPLPGVELQVRGAGGVVQPAGEAGLIFVRGAQVAGEYRGTGSLLDEHGWFATQDRGWIDDEGYVFLDGREDDVIVRGGENISPGEVEEALLAHPAVSDVAVVAAPSEQWGEAVAAVVVLGAGQAASIAVLQQWVRERLRSSRVPETIMFRDTLPYNETGKLLRRVLRQELRNRAG